MYDEDKYIQLASLQHFLFCARQCALIHVCEFWEENRFTAKGQVFHEKVHSGKSETRKQIHTERGLTIVSRRLGLSGKTDATEFIDSEKGKIVYPVEYKSGKPKKNLCDEVQLCAQGLCLEEMLNITIPKGAIYYGQIRHRVEVLFSDQLRQKTMQTIKETHHIIDNRIIPAADPSKKCTTCSLNDFCMPNLPGNSRLKSYIEEIYSNYETSSEYTLHNLP